MFSSIPMVGVPCVDSNTPPIKMAVIQDGIALCQDLRNELVMHGIYPALTGGLLYKPGERKDIDIVLYSNRQDHPDGMPETITFESQLLRAGVTITSHHGFVTKAMWNGFVVDLFNPQTIGGSEYTG